MQGQLGHLNRGTRHGPCRKIFYIFEENLLNNFCRGQKSKKHLLLLFLDLSTIGGRREIFRYKNSRLKPLKKANLKAKMAFTCEVKKCSAQKVVY